MTLRRRLALAFGATLLLFCLNLMAHFVTSYQRDASLRRFSAAVQRGLLWTSLEHEYRTRWQELSVLSELPLTTEQAREVRTRIAQLTARSAGVQVVDDSSAPVTAFQQQQQTFEQVAGAWLDRRLSGESPDPSPSPSPSASDAAAQSLAQLLAKLEALKVADEVRVTDATAQLVYLSALMNEISVAMLLLSMLLAVSIGVAFSRYLTGALRTLQSGAERIGSGDLTARIDPMSQDELGSLARSFNEMTDRLAQTMGELKEARAQADRASQAKSAFLANMSHEFRTPMLAVQGYAELVQQTAEQLG